MLERIIRDLQPVEWPHMQTLEKLKKELQRWSVTWSQPRYSIPPGSLKGRGNRRVRKRNKGVKIGLRRKVRSGEKVLLALSLVSHHPTVFLIAMNYINLPQTKTAFAMMVFGKWSPVLISAHKFFIPFFLWTFIMKTGWDLWCSSTWRGEGFQEIF